MTAPNVIDANVMDLYHGDNNDQMPDFKMLAASGIWAVWHKASQGSHYRDALFVARIRAAHAAGLLVGAYHFLDNSPAPDQSKNFLEAVTCADIPMPLAADYERSSSTPSITTLASFLYLTDGTMTDGEYLTVIYSSDLIRETFRPGFHIENHRLWLAEYGPHLHVPPPWKTAWLWQFSDNGRLDDIAGHVDLNFYPGTKEQLTAEWK
jgi:lysozyme